MRDVDLQNVVKAAIARVERRVGQNLSDRKLYTLVEFDWGSTYGFGDEKYGGAYCRTPAGIYMIEGSPCRGVVVIYQAWDGWRVNFVDSHRRLKFVIPFKEGRRSG